MSDSINFFNSTYSNFREEIAAQIRAEAFLEDIGQNSWTSVSEYREFFGWLNLSADSHVLEIASGSGGPALFMAKQTGCHLVGLDINPHGIETANRAAQEHGLSERVRFQLADGSAAMPFADSTFDAVMCIDSINHLPDRPRVFQEWYRVLKSNGYLLFTDPITVTGLLTKDEIAIRSSIGYFLFAAPDIDAYLVQQAGFELIRRHDATQSVADVAGRWLAARAKRETTLRDMEGDATFEGTQQFLEVAHRVSDERRLSRFIFLAHKAVSAPTS